MRQPPIIDFHIAPAKAVEELAVLRAAGGRWLDALDHVRRLDDTLKWSLQGARALQELEAVFRRTLEATERLEMVARRLEGM